MFPISNTARDLVASNGASSIHSTGCTEMTSVCLPDPSEDETLLRSQHAELREWLTEAILLLPEQERLVFTLHYYERLTTEEIKQVLGATESSISQLHASALSRLRASLADRANCAPLVVARTGKTIQ
jgi:RNA polymerase sigma factor (sigma-70 family)